jgi:transcriptional regulator with XRE-family HTH domain
VTTSITKNSLLEDLKDKETRDIYVEEHIVTGLPFQIHGLREKHGLTQSELAKRAGMAQERISKLEDPNYEFIPKIPTLLKLASVFDVPLIVKFGSWSEFFDRETRLSPELLAPRTFDEEIDSLQEAASSIASYTVPINTFAVPGHFQFEGVPVQWAAVPDIPGTVTVANAPWYTRFATLDELEQKGLITWVPLPKEVTEAAKPIEETDTPTSAVDLLALLKNKIATDFPKREAA